MTGHDGKGQVFADEGDERYYLYIPATDREGKETKVNHAPRIELWGKYLTMVRTQMKSVLIILICAVVMVAVLPFAGAGLVIVVVGFVMGHELKTIVLQQEYKNIVFNRHYIPYPFMEA